MYNSLPYFCGKFREERAAYYAELDFPGAVCTSKTFIVYNVYMYVTFSPIRIKSYVETGHGVLMFLLALYVSKVVPNPNGFPL
jgi:hypothetical protein